jgi:soluble lytic murein transglycosylase-like protein
MKIIRTAWVVAAGILLFSQPARAMSKAEIPSLIDAIIQAESSGRPTAIGDHGRARGLMQIQECVWQKYTRASFDRAFDADMNRKVGESHVRHIIKRYGPRASRALVIYTYNTGRFCKGALPSWTKHHPNMIYRSIFLSEIGGPHAFMA